MKKVSAQHIGNPDAQARLPAAFIADLSKGISNCCIRLILNEVTAEWRMAAIARNIIAVRKG